MMHTCFGNYEPGKDCRACIEQKQCREQQAAGAKKSPGRPKKEKAAAGPAENKGTSDPDLQTSGSYNQESDSLL